MPSKRGKNISNIIAVTHDGVKKVWNKEGAMTAPDIVHFIRNVLPRARRPITPLVLDNSSLHKGKQVADAARDRGYILWFLPAYSPDMAPIEPIIGMVKNYVRHQKPRSYAEAVAAVDEGLEKVTVQNIQRCYKHCGFKPMRICKRR